MDPTTPVSETGTHSLSFLTKEDLFKSEKERRQFLKSMKPPGRDPYRHDSPLVIDGLTEKEAKRLGEYGLGSRLLIYSQISQFYAYNNYVSGYGMTERIVATVGRILNESDFEKILQLPKGAQRKIGLPQYSNDDVTLVRKVYESTMAGIQAADETTCARFSDKGKGGTKYVGFRTFWKDGFILYRNFVYNYARVTSRSYKNAIKHCSLLGRSLVHTKAMMREAIEVWKRGVTSREELEDHLRTTEFDAYEKQTYDEMCRALMNQNDPDPDYVRVTPVELFPLLKLLVLKKVAEEKDEKKKAAPQRTRATKKPSTPKNTKNLKSDKKRGNNGSKGPSKKKRASKRAKKKSPQTGDVPDMDPTSSDEEESDDEAPDVPPAIDVPIHDPSEAYELEGESKEFLVLEIPYLEGKSIINNADIEEAKKSGPHLVGGTVYAPEGSVDLMMMIFIEIRDVFVYSFERADVTFHGQVTKKEKEKIEQYCGKPHTTLQPDDRLFSIFGIKLMHHSCPLYKECFGGMKADPKRAHAYLREVATETDKERNTLQATMGWSTQNHDKTKKTHEELEERLLDSPSWVGTDKDFQELAPYVKEIFDCLQDFIDKTYTGPFRQLTGKVRYETFARVLNGRLACCKNRFEVWTVAIAYLLPRCNTLSRHCDKANDVRDGYTVTVIWSTVFEDTYTVVENGIQVTKRCIVRLSLIGYTRKVVGNYMEKITTYVSTFRSRIQGLMALEHYKNVNNYKLLDLVELVASGALMEIGVWPGDTINTIKGIVIPMFFNPCATFSAFAWCITRMHLQWDLTRPQVIQLVYLASLQCSTLPFVWMTYKLFEKGDEYCREEIKRLGIMPFYHAEIFRISNRDKVQGGAYTRHQVTMTHFPGTEGPNNPVFTESGLEKLKADVETLDNILSSVADHTMDGKTAITTLQKKVDMMGTLCRLKFMPLAALVGLLDIEVCFKDALYAETPHDKPHGKALREMGCEKHNEQKYLQGLNEWLGEPRENSFHADHVLCMAQGLVSSPNKRKWEVFFPEMPLLRFAEDEDRRVITILRKEYGQKEWKRYQPHLLWANSKM